MKTAVTFWKPVVLAALPLGMFLSGCAASPSTPSLPQNQGVATVDVQAVHLQAVPSFYRAAGTIAAQFQTTVSAEVSAKVTAVYVHAGSIVTKGQPLIELNGATYQSNLQAASAAVQSAKANHQSLVATAAMQAAQSKAGVLAAESGVLQARAALASSQAKLNLDREGPRQQERVQAKLNVQKALAALNLATINKNRISSLVQSGALPRERLDQAQTAYQAALDDYNNALQSESIVKDGTRKQQLDADIAQVQQAEAAVKQAQANLRSAQAGVTQVAVTQAQAEAAQAQARQSQAEEGSARIALGDTVIRAPFSGIITQKLVNVGTLATPGTPLLQIEGGIYRLQATVPESVKADCRLRQTVPVQLAGTNRQFDGVVSEIASAGDPSTHTFTVKIDLPLSPQLASGLFGEASIQTGSRQSILIPQNATWTTQGLHYVYVVNSNKILRLRLVSLGDQAGSEVEVTSGLSIGDEVVVSNHDGLKDAMSVSLSEGQAQ